MRVTTKMMSGNLMGNINSNKNSMYKEQEKYSTGKVIQRPSDDPVVAIRSMKLRTNISEMEQYLNKNIPDAMSWMDITESAMKSMNNIFQYMYTNVTKGANDTLTTSDRRTITESLEQLKTQIYQEGNANYAGRYVFTGYRTDSSLTFQNACNDEYNITQTFTKDSITKAEKVTNTYSLKDFLDDDGKIKTNSVIDENKMTKGVEDIYRIRLGYKNLNIKYDANNEIDKNNTIKILYGDTFIDNEKIIVTNSYDKEAYKLKEDEIAYLADTGEIIMGKDVYEKISSDNNIAITYNKNKFEAGDVKPEHYFDCDNITKGKTYTIKEQEICYEVNFSQSMIVNSQIRDVLSIDFGRCVDDMVNALSEVTLIENSISEIEYKLENDKLSSEEKEVLENLKEQNEIELSIKNKYLRNTFENGLNEMKKYQEDITISTADLGSKYARLNLIQTRLDSQLTDYTELLSTNEDVDMVDTYIKYSSMDAVYNASLSVASKVTKNSLLDFI